MNQTSFIVGPNSSGKTRKLLEFAKANNCVVICRDSGAMERKAQAYGIYGLKFLDYQETLGSIMVGNNLFKNDPLWDKSTSYVVDEFANFMKFLLPSNLVGFTQTED